MKTPALSRRVAAVSLWLPLACAWAQVHEDNGTPVAPATATVCAGCHGTDGNSSQPWIPNLAGQSAEYLLRQLRAFRSGTRRNETMNAIAGRLSESDTTALAIYFAAQAPKSAGGDSRLVGKGQALYQACWGCHGMDAAGQEGYPRLAGQHPEYVIRQLQNFRDGIRTNPAMEGIVEKLRDGDMEALGNYLGSLE